MMPGPLSSPLKTERTGSKQGSTARIAGALLMLTAVITAVSAFGRLAADADQPTIKKTLDAISLNTGLYGMGGATRLIAGITLIAAASFLGRTWIIRQRLGSPLVPRLFVLSGGFTAISGFAAFLLAIWVSSLLPVPSDPDMSQLLESALLIRWLTGKIGFAVAGLALIGASRFQWEVGGALRFIAPISMILGVAMQFIWIDSATLLHPIIGAAFFVWLLAVGAMLFTGRTEKLSMRMIKSV